MTQVDPRIARRRRAVQEERAHSSFRRVLVLLGIGLCIAGIIWVARSPLFQIEQLTVSGVSSSGVPRLLAEAGVEVGTPLISVDPKELASRLEGDPWVESARVIRRWPRGLRVSVVERVPVAVVARGSSFELTAVDGTVLSSRLGPDPFLPTVRAEADPRPGLVFASELRDDLAAGATIVVGAEEVRATVAGYEVRLGRGVDMAAKARALAGVLDAHPPEGAIITLVAPSRPAILDPTASPPEDGTNAPEG